MIASITGNITELDVDRVVIETGGVGYEIWISFRTYLTLKPLAGKTVRLLVHHQITDRNQKLFGFIEKKEKEFFSAMKSLNGIGEATAMKILSFLTAEDIYKAAKNNDNVILEKIPKIKSKTSEKILFELNRNLKKFASLVEETSAEKSTVQIHETAIAALTQLGFDEKTAAKYVNQISKEKNLAEAGEIIREVLQNF